MNLAAKHNIEVSLRPTDTVVLTIVNIEERQVRNADGSTMNADVLIGLATESGAPDYGTRYTVRLNNVTAGQLVRLFGPGTDDMAGKRVLAAPFTKGDRSYVSFAHAPARNELDGSTEQRWAEPQFRPGRTVRQTGASGYQARPSTSRIASNNQKGDTPMYEKHVIMGNLGREPEMRYTPAGVPVADFSVAVNKRYTNKDGERVEKTTWYKVTCWRKLAETSAQYLKKGRTVIVEGDLAAEAYTDQGRQAAGQAGHHRHERAVRRRRQDGRRERAGREWCAGGSGDRR